MNFFKDLITQKTAPYKIKGSHNYHTSIKIQGLTPYSTSSITIQTFSSPKKKIAVATKKTWFIIRNKKRVKIDNKNSNYFHLSIEIAGLQLIVEIDPIEDFYKGKIDVIFKKILIHPHLRERLLILKPLEGRLKEGVKFGHVCLVDLERDKVFENFVLELENSCAVLKNYYEGVEFRVFLGESLTVFKNFFFLEKDLGFQVFHGNVKDFKEVLGFLKLGEHFRFLKLGLRFDSREDKELFLALVKLLQIKNFQMNNFRLYEKNINSKEFFHLVNQLKSVKEENDFLLYQLDEFKNNQKNNNNYLNISKKSFSNQIEQKEINNRLSLQNQILNVPNLYDGKKKKKENSDFLSKNAISEKINVNSFQNNINFHDSTLKDKNIYGSFKLKKSPKIFGSINGDNLGITENDLEDFNKSTKKNTISDSEVNLNEKLLLENRALKKELKNYQILKQKYKQLLLSKKIIKK